MTPTPDDDLLRHQAFLQRLALRLVRDEHTARDLVQSASVAYLMAPPRDGDAARGWLERVVRRLAARRHRAEHHRGDRERSAARPESESHEFAAVDAALDAQTALLALVRGLPDAQREAIVFRYLHDQSPAEIAAKLGVSVHTVNTRLRRALEHLREQLDRGAQGDRRAWAVALLPRLPSAGPSVAAGSFSLIAALTMATTMKLVAGAAVLAALLYGLRLTSDAPERMESVVSPTLASSEAIDALATGAAGAPRTAIEVAVDVSGDAEPTPVGAALAAVRDPWLLELTVDGAGVERRPTEVVLIGINGYNWTEEQALRVKFDAPGRTDIDVRNLIALWDARFARDRAIAGVLVRVEHPDCVSRTVKVDVISDGSKDAEPTQPLTASVTLERAAVLTGEVVFPGVDLANEVIVLAFPMGDDMPRDALPLAAIPPDAHGRFCIRVRTSDRIALVALHERFRPITRVVSIAIGASQELGRLEATVGAVLTGVVVFGEHPVGEGAQVSVRLADAGRTWGSLGVNFGAMLAWRDGRFEWGQHGAVTDARGQFRCAGLGPWPVTVSCWSLPDHDSHPGGSVESRVTPPIDVVVTVGMVAVELSYDFGGANATSGRMELQVADGSILEFDVPAHVAVGSSRRFTCAPDVPIVARAQFEGFELAELSFRSPSTPGARVKQRFELKPSTHAPASLRVHAGAQGAPLPDGTTLQLAFEPSESTAQRVSNPRVVALAIVGGDAVLEQAPFGPHRLRVYPSDIASRRTTRYVDQVFEIDLGAGDTHELRCDFVLGGNVSLEARAPEGQLVAGWCTVFDEQRREVGGGFFTDLPGMTYGGFSGRGPSVLMHNLLPGRYTIELTTTDYALYTDVIEIRPGEVTSKTFQLSSR